MKVFADNIIVNNGISRIVDAFKKYSPKEIEFVEREKDADLVIIYAYGQRRKVEKRIKWIRERGQKYAMIQIAIRSTANPSTHDWISMWEKAEIVWSYYHLQVLVLEDGYPYTNFNFYYAPLGVDVSIFKDYYFLRAYKVVVGDSRDESVSEVVRAAKGNVFHLGTGITDEELVIGYNRSEYVSGLRRKEGFELPVLEGLMCGARPICYDRPHYRQWFGDLVEYISETHPEDVVHSLEEMFKRPARPVTDKEKQRVASNFSWQEIINNFWSKI